MIIYTTMPLEDVLQEENDTEVKYKDTSSGTVILQKDEEGRWFVQRLVSSNPADYLRSDYQPGEWWQSDD
ncbi:YlzJ-like family protein [Natribacillus halophilus]|uniref:YlzJ-like protein n=1 Tax=Natribacillus halophilus TaxID=549003 RepID=A0A1G8PRL3_9BACI|nr:YlzJ-like family protein [Natribacillus halophilus]SDI95062.1 YlzJ-like protein [Natribacillus halophilus]